MPETIPYPLSDIALATSTANAISVSQGPGQVPLADANFAWNPSARQHTLKGQGFGVGGDRWNLQTSGAVDLSKYDLNGSLWFNHLANTTGFSLRMVPNDVNTPVTFNMASSCGSSNGPSAQLDAVMSWGWNVDGGAGNVNPGYHVLRDGAEYFYSVNGTTYQTERHFSTLRLAGAGTEVRPLSVAIGLSTANGTTTPVVTNMAAGQLLLTREDAVTPLLGVQYNNSGPVHTHTLWGPGSSDPNGYPLQTISVGGVNPQDTLNIGRFLGRNNVINYQSTGLFSHVYKFPGELSADHASFTVDGTLNGGMTWQTRNSLGNVLFQCGGGFFVQSRNGSKNYLAIDGNGNAGLGSPPVGTTRFTILPFVNTSPAQVLQAASGQSSDIWRYLASDGITVRANFTAGGALGATGLTITAGGPGGITMSDTASHVPFILMHGTSNDWRWQVTGNDVDQAVVKNVTTGRTPFTALPNGAVYHESVTVTFANPLPLDVSRSNYQKVSLTGDTTVNANGAGNSGQRLQIQFTSDATPRTVTWGTNFRAGTPNYVSPASKKTTLEFTSDGSEWVESGNRGAI